MDDDEYSGSGSGSESESEKDDEKDYSTEGTDVDEDSQNEPIVLKHTAAAKTKGMKALETTTIVKKEVREIQFDPIKMVLNRSNERITLSRLEAYVIAKSNNYGFEDSLYFFRMATIMSNLLDFHFQNIYHALVQSLYPKYRSHKGDTILIEKMRDALCFKRDFINSCLDKFDNGKVIPSYLTKDRKFNEEGYYEKLPVWRLPGIFEEPFFGYENREQLSYVLNETPTMPLLLPFIIEIFHIGVTVLTNKSRMSYLYGNGKVKSYINFYEHISINTEKGADLRIPNNYLRHYETMGEYDDDKSKPETIISTPGPGNPSDYYISVISTSTSSKPFTII